MHDFIEYNKPIQELIKIMKDDYPNGFELRINGFSAELVNNQTVQCYIKDDLLGDYCCISNEEAKKIVEEFLNKENPS